MRMNGNAYATAVPHPLEKQLHQVAERMSRALRIAAQDCVASFEDMPLWIDAEGMHWHDTRPALDPMAWGTTECEYMQERIDCALQHGWAQRHPVEAHYLRITPEGEEFAQ